MEHKIHKNKYMKQTRHEGDWGTNGVNIRGPDIGKSLMWNIHKLMRYRVFK